MQKASINKFRASALYADIFLIAFWSHRTRAFRMLKHALGIVQSLELTIFQGLECTYIPAADRAAHPSTRTTSERLKKTVIPRQAVTRLVIPCTKKSMFCCPTRLDCLLARYEDARVFNLRGIHGLVQSNSILKTDTAKSNPCPRCFSLDVRGASARESAGASA